jgi:FeS assembly SUF system regulator
MIRLTRLTDYGILLLTRFASGTGEPMRSARDLAEGARLPLPTVSKILKLLARHGLLEAHRGVKGGFTLARPADRITMAEIIRALEGPIGVTDCSAETGACEIENTCTLKTNWMRINRVVTEALDRINLSEMVQPLHAVAPVEWRHGTAVRKP